MINIFKPLKKLIKICLFSIIVLHIFVVVVLWHWQNNPVQTTAFMLNHTYFNDGQINQQWVDYNKISKPVKRAVIASEDAKFVEHNGFDTKSIQQAFKQNSKIGKASVGGSTITQQLAKNLFLTHHRSYIRKAEEAIITLIIENMWDKKRILEVYLNVVEFGEGIYGIESAAQYYFNKPAHKLNNEEAALLISMLPQPKYYQKHLNNKKLRQKQRIVVRRISSATLPQ